MVSIIIPTYNSAQYIIESINSVINQTYKNIECIVIDDGSTDNTAELLEELINSNSIRYYYQKNKGVSIARNLGIAKANGEFLLFLDADDLLEEDAIEFLIGNINNKGIIFGNWIDFNETGHRTNHYQNNKHIDQLTKYLLNKPTVSTALIKKSATVFWDESIKVWEVTDYFLNVILKKVDFKFYTKIVTKIRQHDSPTRATLLQQHFNPLVTLSFLENWKQNIHNNNMLNKEVEAVIDSEIIDNIYTALRNNVKINLLKPFFSKINIKNLKSSPTYKQFGLLFFIYHTSTFNSIIIFKTINKYLGRS